MTVKLTLKNSNVILDKVHYIMEFEDLIEFTYEICDEIVIDRYDKYIIREMIVNFN